MPESELTCRDCGAAFVFTDAEREFFRAQGFVHPPKRCKACRAKNRKSSPQRVAHAPAPPTGEAVVRLAGNHGPTTVSAGAVADAVAGAAADAVAGAVAEGRRAESAPEPRHPRAPRPPSGVMHPAVCSVCGETAEVPFVPDGVRPVFCLPCLKKRTR